MRCAKFSTDGTRIVTTSDDRTARVWDIKPENRYSKFRWKDWDDENVRALGIATDSTRVMHIGRELLLNRADYSPGGTRISTVANEKTVCVRDPDTGDTLATLAGHEKRVMDAQFNSDGSRIVTASNDKTARVWDANTGKMLVTLIGHERPVLFARFSPDGTRIVTGSDDCTVSVWDAVTGKRLETFTKVYVIFSGGNRTQYSLDGTRIVLGDDGGIREVWDVLPPSAGAVPAWFPDFLRYMAQMRLNSDGELETIKTVDWLALRERLRGVMRLSAEQDTPYLRILRRFVHA